MDEWITIETTKWKYKYVLQIEHIIFCDLIDAKYLSEFKNQQMLHCPIILNIRNNDTKQFIFTDRLQISHWKLVFIENQIYL